MRADEVLFESVTDVVPDATHRRDAAALRFLYIPIPNALLEPESVALTETAVHAGTEISSQYPETRSQVIPSSRSEVLPLTGFELLNCNRLAKGV